MIDHDGETWLPVAEAARIARVRPSAIHTWVNRGKVRAHRIGQTSHAHLGDVLSAEAEWTRRMERQAGVEPK